MQNTWGNQGKRAWLTGLLGAYILLQFSWWAYLLIRQHETIESLESTSGPARSSWMILGEGVVFLGLLTWGFIVIWKGLQRERNQARKERHFLLAVTHELKTPIAGTQLALETLQKHQLDKAKQTELFHDAAAGLRRLEQRVENILQNNRIVSGQAMRKEPFDIESILQQVVEMQQTGPYRDRGIRLIPSNEAIGLLEGDADALALAWGNLLENALKYSPEQEEVVIEIRAGKGHLFCDFDDGGPGIPRTKRALAIQKFERIEHSETTGTGLGLYLADQIIRMHDGRLTIGASQRGGCRITTQLPLIS